MTSTRVPRERFSSFEYIGLNAKEGPRSGRSASSRRTKETDLESQDEFAQVIKDPVIKETEKYKRALTHIRRSLILDLLILIVGAVAFGISANPSAEMWIAFGGSMYVLICLINLILIKFSKSNLIAKPQIFNIEEAEALLGELPHLNPVVVSSFNCKCSKGLGKVIHENVAGSWFDLSPVFHVLPHSKNENKEFLKLHLKQFHSFFPDETDAVLYEHKEHFLEGHDEECEKSFRQVIEPCEHWPDVLIVDRGSNRKMYSSFVMKMRIAFFFFTRSFVYRRFKERHVDELTISMHKVFTIYDRKDALEGYKCLNKPREVIEL